MSGRHAFAGASRQGPPRWLFGVLLLRSIIKPVAGQPSRCVRRGEACPGRRRSAMCQGWRPGWTGHGCWRCGRAANLPDGCACACVCMCCGCPTRPFPSCAADMGRFSVPCWFETDRCALARAQPARADTCVAVRTSGARPLSPLPCRRCGKLFSRPRCALLSVLFRTLLRLFGKNKPGGAVRQHLRRGVAGAVGRGERRASAPDYCAHVPGCACRRYVAG